MGTAFDSFAAWLLEGVYNLLSTLVSWWNSFLPDPFLSLIEQLPQLPAGAGAWINYYVNVTFVSVCFASFIAIWLASIVIRFLMSWLKLGGD